MEKHASGHVGNCARYANHDHVYFVVEATGYTNPLQMAEPPVAAAVVQNWSRSPTASSAVPGIAPGALTTAC